MLHIKFQIESRLANLPPEIPDRTISVALSPYEEVKEVHEELWSTAYRYPVHNGVRIAVTNMKKIIPSHTVIVGTRVLITYEGQSPTCYGCNEQGHHYQDCPRRRQTVSQRVVNPSPLGLTS
jgi:hypothetical protein